MQRVLTIVLLVLLIMVGGGAAYWVLDTVVHRKMIARRRDDSLALPSGGDKLIERSIRDLRVGDVVTMDARDFLVEGTVGYDEDGHRWVGARVVDGSDEKWMVVGIERSGAAPVRVLVHDTETEVAGYPPEVMVIGDTRYNLDKRGTATCKLAGDLALLAGGKHAERPDGHVERCRWWLYNGAGDDTFILEQWGGDFRLLRGRKVSPDTIDLIPGS
jgi:hypothetical protein